MVELSLKRYEYCNHEAQELKLYYSWVKEVSWQATPMDLSCVQSKHSFNPSKLHFIAEIRLLWFSASLQAKKFDFGRPVTCFLWFLLNSHVSKIFQVSSTLVLHLNFMKFIILCN